MRFYKEHHQFYLGFDRLSPVFCCLSRDSLRLISTDTSVLFILLYPVNTVPLSRPDLHP